MKKFILTALIFAHTTVNALEPDKAAHLGVSYLLTTMTYGVIRKSLGAPQLPSIIFSSTIVGFVGLCKEGLDPKMDQNDMLYNTFGIALSIGTVLVFDF